MELRIGLIENNQLVRAGRAMVINSQDDMKVVYEESDPKAALAKSAEYLIDVLVVESNPRGYQLAKYLELCRENLSAAGSNPAILVSSTFANPQLRSISLASGASDLVDLESSAEVFLAALRRCAKGDYLADRASLLQAIEHQKPLDTVNRDSLTALAKSQPGIVGNFLDGLSDLSNSKKLDIAKLRVRQTIDALLKAGNFQTRNQLAIALLGERK
jgi:DNA-binding NarL/FixJ family response regulator